MNLQTSEWGPVGLSLSTDGQGGAVVVVQAASEAAQQALSQRSPDLVDTMQALGLTVQVDVRQGPWGGGAAGGGGQMPQPQSPPQPPQDSADVARPAVATPARGAAIPATGGSALNFYA